MAERDPIDLIREQLTGMEELTGLLSDHESFVRWLAETKMILEKIFSSKSIYHQNFVALKFREVNSKFFASPEVNKLNATRYKRDLENARNILQGALKELTLDRTLFKKMQTTPKTVEVALQGDCFLSSNITEPEIIQAIEAVFEGTGLRLVQHGGNRKEESSFRHSVDQIKHCKLGIYDLSTPDSIEVVLELGAALALGREVFIIYIKGSQRSALLDPFDPLEYEDYSDLRAKLKKKLKL
jgi:hypothetical protein